MHYCVFMHWRISLFFHDSTNTYTTRQESVLYVYHNAAVTVVIANGCLASTAPRECSPDQKWGPRGVRTDWSVHTHACGPCVG